MLGYLWFELILVSYSQLALYPLTLKHAFQKDEFLNVGHNLYSTLGYISKTTSQCFGSWAV